METLPTLYPDSSFTLVNEEHYSYNNGHQITKTLLANGKEINTEWICKGPTRIIDQYGGETRTFYNSAKQVARIERDASPITTPLPPLLNSMETELPASRLVELIPLPSIIEEFIYDSSGNVTKKTTTQDTKITTESYTYDLLGRMTSSTDSFSHTTFFSYSQDGLTTTMYTPLGATFITEKNAMGDLIRLAGTGQQTLYFTYTLGVAGKTQAARLNSLTGEIVSKIHYDVKGRIECRSHRHPDGGFIDQTYLYNDKDQLIREAIRGLGPKFYKYDDLGNLLTTTIDRFDPNADDETPPAEYFQRSPLYWSQHYDFIMGNDMKEVLNQFQGTNADHDIYNEQNLPLIAYLQTTNPHGNGKQSSLSTMVSSFSPTLDSFQVFQDQWGHKHAQWSRTYDKGNKWYHRQKPDSAHPESYLVVDGRLRRKILPCGKILSYNYSLWGVTDGITIIDEQGNSVHVFYDLLGREICRNEDGRITELTYEGANPSPSRIKYTDDTEAHFHYDVRGRKVAEWGTAITPKCFSYDEADRLTGMTTFQADNGVNQDIITAPTNRTDGHTTQWIYDPISGFLLKKVMPNGNTIAYTYNAWGAVHTKKQFNPSALAKMITTTYTYKQGSGELTQIDHSDGTPSVFYHYNDNGKVDQIKDASGVTDFAYNSYQELEKEVTTRLGPIVDINTLQYHYDTYGRMDGYSFSENGNYKSSKNNELHHVGITFDEISRINQFRLNHNNTFSLDYEARQERLSSLTYPTTWQKHLAYDPQKGYLKSVTFNLLGFDAIEYQHEAEFDTRDRINRLRSYRTSVSGLYANMREDQSLEYNSRGELIKKTCLGTEPAFFTDALLPASPSIHRALGSAVPPVPPVIYSYAYDNSNNRTRSHEEGYEVAYNNMDKNNAYASILAGSKQTEFLYDAQGNATRIVTDTGTWSVVYDADNRPIEFSGEGNKQGTNIIFDYDYQGRRTKKSVYRYGSRISEKYFHYKGSLLIAEKESVTKPQIGTVIEKHAEYLWDPSEPVATRPLARTHYVPRAGNMPTGESGPRYTEYYFHDLHKNVTEIVGNDGRPIAYYYYSGPYGNAKELLAYPPHEFDYPPYEINPNDNIALQPDNPFQYSSEYYDKDLALVQYHYRDYNPRIGRWLTPDPIEEEGGTNLYAFVSNDPVNNVDYLGKNPFMLTDAVVTDFLKYHDKRRVSSSSANKTCEKYSNHSKSKCCGKNNETQDDTYPERAEQMCKDFVSKYSNQNNEVIKSVECVAECLTKAEDDIQKEPSCAARNANRLESHVSCYTSCGFNLVSVDSIGVPSGGIKIGLTEMLPDYFSELFKK